MTNEDVEKICNKISEKYPSAIFKTDPPMDEINGVWTIDIHLGDKLAYVEWFGRERRIGVTGSEDEEAQIPFCGPNKVFDDIDTAMAKIDEIFV